jgi:hypothetical protein
VIVAAPAATPVTRPPVLTVAIEVLLEVQLTFLLVALAGETVAVSCCVAFVAIDAEVGDTVTPVTGTVVAVTVIVDVAVLAPSCVVTVIVAVPAAIAETNPPVLTVATEVLFAAQLTVLLVAFAGATVAVSCCVVPTAIDADVGETETPVTATEDAVTVMEEEAVFAPSCVVTVMVAVPAATPETNPLALTVATAVLLDDQLTV